MSIYFSNRKALIILQALGIIAEYNPFHNGHLYHLTESKKSTEQAYAIAVMSGNFVQRGEPALFDKWTRAAMAVNGGVDLVIELPFAFTVRSAQNFAEGAVELLASLGIVKHLSFGSENADYPLLQKIADLSAEQTTIDTMKQRMKTGASYAASLSAALNMASTIPVDMLNQPNNILAIEYLKALRKSKCGIKPFLLKRKTAAYHDTATSCPIASATAIRRHLAKDAAIENITHTLPASTAKIIRQTISSIGDLPNIANLDAALLASLRLAKPFDLTEILTVSEGLENKIIQAALKSTTGEELLFNIKSKRYPLSRLQRMLLHLLLRSPKELFRQFDESGPLYARVLAFNDNGRRLIKEIKTTSALPIIIKMTDYLNTDTRTQENLSLLQKMLSFDTYAAELYGLCFNQRKLGATDFTRSPLYIRQQ